MNQFAYSNGKICTIPSLEDSLHIFSDSTMDSIEYNSPLCIFYVQHGKVEKRINNRKFLISSGDLIMIPPDSHVSLSSAGEFSGVSVFFSNIWLLLPTNSSAFLEEKVQSPKKLFNNYSLQKHTYGKLKNHFNYIINESSSGSFEKISELLRNDVAYYFERLPLVNRKRATTKLNILQRVESIKLHIEENCTKKFDLNTIAKASLMSKFALIRNFKEVFKTTPHQYYVQKKITLAKEFLSCGMSVKETAIRCGYPDIFSFSKQFKLVEGHCPRKFQIDLRATRNQAILSSANLLR